MNKITFMGAGSTVFVRNVLGDCMCSDALKDWEYALYDIDATRLEESFEIISAMNETKGGHARITKHLGVENRKEALCGAREHLLRACAHRQREEQRHSQQTNHDFFHKIHLLTLSYQQHVSISMIFLFNSVNKWLHSSHSARPALRSVG